MEEYNIYNNNNTNKYKDLYELYLKQIFDMSGTAISKMTSLPFSMAEDVYDGNITTYNTMSNDDIENINYLPYLYDINYIPISDNVHSEHVFAYVKDNAPELYSSIFDTIFMDMFGANYILDSEACNNYSTKNRNKRLILNISMLNIPKYNILYDELESLMPWTIYKDDNYGYANVASMIWVNKVSSFLDSISAYNIHGICIDDIDDYNSVTGIDQGDMIKFVNKIYRKTRELGIRLYIKTNTKVIGDKTATDGVVISGALYKNVSNLIDVQLPSEDIRENISFITRLNRDGKEVYTIEYAKKVPSINTIITFNELHSFSSYIVEDLTLKDISYSMSNVAGEYPNVFSDGLEIHQATKHRLYFGDRILKKSIFTNGEAILYDNIDSIYGVYEYNYNPSQNDHLGTQLYDENYNYNITISGNKNILNISGLSGIYYIDYLRDNIYYYNDIDNTISFRNKYDNILASSTKPGISSNYRRINTPLDRLASLYQIDREDENVTNEVLKNRIEYSFIYKRDDTDEGIRNSIAIDNDFINSTSYVSGTLTLSGASPNSLRVNGLEPEHLFQYPLSADDQEHDSYKWEGTVSIPAGSVSEIEFKTYVDKDIYSVNVSRNLPCLYVDTGYSNYSERTAISNLELFNTVGSLYSKYNNIFQTEDPYLPNTLRVYYQGYEVTESVEEIGRRGFRFNTYQNYYVSGAQLSGVSEIPLSYNEGDITCSYTAINSDYKPIGVDHLGDIYNNSGIIASRIEADKAVAYGGDTITYTVYLYNLSETNANNISVKFLYPLYFDTPNFNPYDKEAVDLSITINGTDFLKDINKPNSLDILYIKEDDITVNTMTDEYTRAKLLNSDGTPSPTIKNIVENISKNMPIFFGNAIWDLSLWVPESLVQNYLSYLPNVADPDVSRFGLKKKYKYNTEYNYIGDNDFGEGIFKGKHYMTSITSEDVYGIIQREDYDSGIGDNDDLKPMIDENFQRKYYNSDSISIDHIPPRYLKLHNGFYSFGDIRKYLFGRRSTMVAYGNDIYLPLSDDGHNDQNSLLYGGEIFLYSLSGVSGVTINDEITITLPDDGKYSLYEQFTRTNFEDGHLYKEKLYGNGYNNILYTSFDNIRDVYITDQFGRKINDFRVYGNRIHIDDISAVTPFLYANGGSGNHKYYISGTDYAYAPSGVFNDLEIYNNGYKKYQYGEQFDESPTIETYKYFNVEYSIDNSYYVDYDIENKRANIKINGEAEKLFVVYDSNIEDEDNIGNNYKITDVKLHPSYIGKLNGFIFIDDNTQIPAYINIHSPEEIVDRNRNYPIQLNIETTSAHGTRCNGFIVQVEMSYESSTGTETKTYTTMTNGQDINVLFLEMPSNIINDIISIDAWITINYSDEKIMTTIRDSLNITVK